MQMVQINTIIVAEEKIKEKYLAMSFRRYITGRFLVPRRRSFGTVVPGPDPFRTRVHSDWLLRGLWVVPLPGPTRRRNFLISH